MELFHLYKGPKRGFHCIFFFLSGVILAPLAGWFVWDLGTGENHHQPSSAISRFGWGYWFWPESCRFAMNSLERRGVIFLLHGWLLVVFGFFLGSWVIFSGIFWFSLWLIGGLGVIFFSRTVGCFFGKEKPFFFARQNCWLLVGFWCFFLNKIFLCFLVGIF